MAIDLEKLAVQIELWNAGPEPASGQLARNVTVFRDPWRRSAQDKKREVVSSYWTTHDQEGPRLCLGCDKYAEDFETTLHLPTSTGPNWRLGFHTRCVPDEMRYKLYGPPKVDRTAMTNLIKKSFKS